MMKVFFVAWVLGFCIGVTITMLAIAEGLVLAVSSVIAVVAFIAGVESAQRWGLFFISQGGMGETKK